MPGYGQYCPLALATEVLAERRIEYRLTDAGQALLPAIESLAVWSKAWLPATLSDERSDPDLILWDMHRRMNTELLPDGRTVIRFVLVDLPEERRRRWLVCERSSTAESDCTAPRRSARRSRRGCS